MTDGHDADEILDRRKLAVTGGPAKPSWRWKSQDSQPGPNFLPKVSLLRRFGQFQPIIADKRPSGRFWTLRGLLHSRAAFGIALPVAGEVSPPIARMRV
jgi:hypothetical protein